jgi:RNA polymerase sigma-70 factor (ECF subfamily)
VLGPLQQEHLIEECTNDIFLSVWNNGKKFKGDASNFHYWIAAIARFRAIDYYRRAVKNKETGTSDSDYPDLYSVEEEIIHDETVNEVLHLIRLLKPVDQKMMIMRFFLDMTTEEISQNLGLTKSAVDSRIFRARKKLSKKAKSHAIGGNLGERYL